MGKRYLGNTRGQLCAAVLCVLGSAIEVLAQESILNDLNGDGVVSMAAFGDSITYGIGDGVPVGVYVEEVSVDVPPGGYPPRVSALAGIPVTNAGSPGELLTEGGVERFPSVASGSTSDLISIYEGTNDARVQVSSGPYRRSLQRMVNVALALGKHVLVMTTPKPCCIHGGADPFIDSLNQQVKDVADIHDLTIVDIDRAWRSSCNNKSECELYNLPEGLHPNARGYDVIAQTVTAALFGIDVFAVDGPAQLEEQLGLTAGSIIVRPDQVIQAP